MSWSKKKIVILKCHLFLVYTTTNNFLIGLWRVTKKWILYDTGDDKLSGFASSAMFTWPLASYYHFFEHLDNFLQWKLFHNHQETENTFQEFIESRIFTLPE